MALVKLTYCDNNFQAEVLKGRLNDMGIECILQGSNFNNVYGPIPAAAIVVLVEEEDLAKAQELLPIERPASEDAPEDGTIVKPKLKLSRQEVLRNGIIWFIGFPLLSYIIDLYLGSTKGIVEYLISGLVFAAAMLLFSWLELKYRNRNRG